MKKRKAFISTVCIILALLMIFTVVLGVLGSNGALAASRAEIDQLESQKAGIAAKKKELSARISTLQSEQADVIQQKEALDEQNELTRQEIELIMKQLDQLNRILTAKENELKEAIANEEMQRERYRTRVRDMEEKGTVSYISILFDSSSFTDLLSRVDSIKEVMAADKRLEEDYIAAREHVEIVQKDYQITQADTEIRRQELEEKKAKLEADIAAATQLISDLEANIEEFRASFEANEAEERRLGQAIEAMLAEVQRQEEEAKKLAQQSGGSAPIIGSGVLSWPLPGYSSTCTYGWRTHPIFGDQRFHAGWDVGAPSGTPLYAADSGTVVTAVYSSSYGNYVLISHGNGISTLCAHMSSMAVSAGQSVSKGQVIGYVGSTGWSTGPHLHLEVRVNGSTVDPCSYF